MHRVSKSFWSVILVSVFSSLGLHAADDDKIGDYFENLPSSVRDSIIEVAQVTVPSYPNRPVGVDIVDELNISCRGLAVYSRDSSGKIQKPTVKCSYSREDSFDGMTSKFKCKFPTADGGSVKAKVKYAKSLSGSGKELAPAALVSGLSRLLGFVSDAYCPAVVVCEGCSADPWSEMNRSSAPPLANVVNTFEYAVIEAKVEGLKVSEPRNGAAKPLGLAWGDLAMVSEGLSDYEKHALLANREALMLWMNFIYHGDADTHNNRLICQQWSIPSGGTPRCEQSVGYVHDYGDAFFKTNLTKYRNVTVFRTSLIEVPHRWFNKCVGTLGGGEGAIRAAAYSEEARLNFLDRFSNISHQQLVDFLTLAQVDAISGNSIDEWIGEFNKKLGEVRKSRCDSLRSGDTVLSR